MYIYKRVDENLGFDAHLEQNMKYFGFHMLSEMVIVEEMKECL